MSSPPPGTEMGLDLSSLEAISAAVEAGAGLPEVVRAASRALDTSLVLVDRSGQILAVAAKSPADERSLMGDAADVDVVDLRVADHPVGTLRMRSSAAATPLAVRLVSTLVASEVERVRAPERASREAVASFLHQLLARGFSERGDLLARAEELAIELDGGASIVVARAKAHVATDDGWRTRVLMTAERGARAAIPGTVAALRERADSVGAEVVLLVPGADEAEAARTAEAVVKELEAGLPGHTFAVGRSRVAADPLHLDRAGNEALLAANVAEGDEERPVLAFEETGAYRLLLPAMSEDPAELQRFYAETVEPLVVYDEQYATDLVQTVEAFLEADGNVAGTAAKLFTHRHTIRYRLERVRELSGLDVGSTDGREKLSLGLKAMRVLGIAAPAGPAAADAAWRARDRHK
ncbi:MAG TPA: helix-turn-helix domain-containing protein [Solirubrobacteraceae bacterium]|nr:helix-turn-helix domain-containing protein [Solirubrobacteraceae bacterium]